MMLGSPEHPKQTKGKHNALEDARWNKELFDFLRAVPSDGGYYLDSMLEPAVEQVTRK
jgi:hypothetical protein